MKGDFVVSAALAKKILFGETTFHEEYFKKARPIAVAFFDCFKKESAYHFFVDYFKDKGDFVETIVEKQKEFVDYLKGYEGANVQYRRKIKYTGKQERLAQILKTLQKENYFRENITDKNLQTASEDLGAKIKSIKVITRAEPLKNITHLSK